MFFKGKFMMMMSSFRKASSIPLRSYRKPDLGKYFLLSIPVSTFALGTWQIQRRSWKLRLIEELESKSNTPPVDLLENLDDLEKLEYYPVKVRGVFDHSKEVYIGPRNLVDKNLEASNGIFTSQSASGYHVITPFKLSGKDLTILVNRGFVPKCRVAPETRLEGQITNEIDLVGIVRLTEKKPPFAVKRLPGSTLFHFRDLDALAETCNTAPIFLDANFESTALGGPKGGQTRVSLRNEHLSYIFTWYSLSAVTSWMWYKKYIKRVPL